MVMRPARGGCPPETTRSNVVLPDPLGPDQDDRGAVAGHGCIEIEGPRAGADLNLPPHFGGEWACGERDGRSSRRESSDGKVRSGTSSRTLAAARTRARATATRVSDSSAVYMARGMV